MTKSRKYPKLLSSILLSTLLIIGSVFLISCTADADVQEQNMAENEEMEEEVAPTAEPTAVPIPDQSAFYEVPHNVYDLGKGPNTWCSRCHSPKNWDPESAIGPPPSCWTCKFDFDEEVRIAENNPLVEEADWAGIPCESCHEVDANGTASPQIAWLNPISMDYVAVNTSTELCEKCHVTTNGNSRGSAVDHKITLGGSAHLNHVGFQGDVAPPQYCGDCHDPHDNQSKPACEDCHAVRELDTHIKGKNAIHTQVTCMACHDSSGLDVGPTVDESKEEGLCVTQFTDMAARGGPSTVDVVSHSPTYEVLCSKCHIEDSPYGLPEYTDDGEIPEVEICKAGETLTVPKPDLAEYGEIDVDYTEGKCPEEDAPTGSPPGQFYCSMKEKI